jgi:hypothetical protein
VTRYQGYICGMAPHGCGFVKLDEYVPGIGRTAFVSKLAMNKLGVTRPGRAIRVDFDVVAEIGKPGKFRAVRLTRLQISAQA